MQLAIQHDNAMVIFCHCFSWNCTWHVNIFSNAHKPRGWVNSSDGPFWGWTSIRTQVVVNIISFSCRFTGYFMPISWFVAIFAYFRYFHVHVHNKKRTGFAKVQQTPESVRHVLSRSVRMSRSVASLGRSKRHMGSSITRGTSSASI